MARHGPGMSPPIRSSRSTRRRARRPRVHLRRDAGAARPALVPSPRPVPRPLRAPRRGWRSSSGASTSTSSAASAALRRRRRGDLFGDLGRFGARPVWPCAGIAGSFTGARRCRRLTWPAGKGFPSRVVHGPARAYGSPTPDGTGSDHIEISSKRFDTPNSTARRRRGGDRPSAGQQRERKIMLRTLRLLVPASMIVVLVSTPTRPGGRMVLVRPVGDVDQRRLHALQ